MSKLNEATGSCSNCEFLYFNSECRRYAAKGTIFIGGIDKPIYPYISHTMTHFCGDYKAMKEPTCYRCGHLLPQDNIESGENICNPCRWDKEAEKKKEKPIATVIEDIPSGTWGVLMSQEHYDQFLVYERWFKAPDPIREVYKKWKGNNLNEETEYVKDMWVAIKQYCEDNGKN